MSKMESLLLAAAVGLIVWILCERRHGKGRSGNRKGDAAPKLTLVPESPRGCA
jgi:hypothetical protein